MKEMKLKIYYLTRLLLSSGLTFGVEVNAHYHGKSVSRSRGGKRRTSQTFIRLHMSANTHD